MRRLCGRFWLVILALLALGGPAFAETIHVTFLLVNDIDQMADSDGRGGYPRVAAVVKAERAAHANVVFVHAGDAISPSLLSGFDQGAHIIQLIDMMRPDAFVPGNHEFDFGPEVFRQRMSEAQFPRLAANLRDAGGQRLPGFEDALMLDVQGVKIGVFGVLTEESDVTSTLGDLVLSPALPSALEQAKKLRESGAQLVVAVAHVPRSADRQLFESRAADLILSGDDHDLMLQFDGRTVLVELFSQGKYVTAVDLTIETTERDGKVSIAWWPDFRVIDTAAVEPDPEVAALVKGFEAELSSELDVVIGRTQGELDSRRATVRTGEAAIGNLIADAMRETTDADVALINGGGIRADRIYPPGIDIARRDVLADSPSATAS